MIEGEHRPMQLSLHCDVVLVPMVVVSQVDWLYSEGETLIGCSRPAFDWLTSFVHDHAD